MLRSTLRFCLPIATLTVLTPQLVSATSLPARLQVASQQAEATWGTGPTEAKGLLYSVLEEAEKRRKRDIEAGARIALARLHVRNIDSLGALAHLELAEELLGPSPDAALQAALAQARGEALRADGQPEAARQSSQQALHLAAALEDGDRLGAFAHLELARLNTSSGDLDAAVEHLQTAAGLFHGQDEPRHARQADLEAAKLLQRLGRYREAVDQLQALADQPSAQVDRNAIRDYLHDLLHPPNTIQRAGNNFFSGIQSGDGGQILAGVAEGLFGRKKRREAPGDDPQKTVKTSGQDAEFQRRRARLEQSLGDSVVSWPPRNHVWHAVPTSPIIEERLVKDCAAVYETLDDDDRVITTWLESDVPGYTWHRRCSQAFQTSQGRLPDDCPASVMALHSMLWDIAPVIPPLCGSWRDASSPRKIRKQYDDFGVVEFPVRSARQSMAQEYKAGLDLFMALNPYGAHFRDVDRRHAATLEMLFDVSLEVEIWNALGQAYKHFSPTTGDAERAFDQAWQASEPVWAGLPQRMGFAPENLQQIRRGGLSLNTFQRRQGPMDSLNWGSFLFDVSRLALWQGQLHQELGNDTLAAAFFHRSLNVQLGTAAQLINPDVELAARIGLARSLTRMERPAAAALYLQTAVELADHLRERLKAVGSATSFADVQSEAYRGLVDLLIDLGDSDLAFYYAEKARARAFLDQLGQRTPGEGTASALPLDFVRHQVLEEGTNLITYFVTPRRVVAWVVEAGASHFVELPEAPGALAEAVHLLDDMEQGGNTEAVLQRLDAALVQPLEDQARHPRWIVVPHGPLHQVPFAALRRAEGMGTSAYLVERRRLTLLPSASALPWVQSQRHIDDRDDGPRALVLGNPGGDLLAAEDEATAVAQLYGAEALLRGEATESSLYRSAPSMDILHLAAHGIIDMAHSKASYLELAAEPEGTEENGPEDGRLELHEVFERLRLPQANLVVLSACRSGRGRRGGADDVVSLPWAFLHAGAPSVVSTLWEVEDAPSASLMQRFHSLLRQGKAPDAALQQAQQEILANAATTDPYYWAGFTLTGDPLAWGTPPPRTTSLPPAETRRVPDRWTGSRRGSRPAFERRTDPDPAERRSLPDNWPGLESSRSGGGR